MTRFVSSGRSRPLALAVALLISLAGATQPGCARSGPPAAAERDATAARALDDADLALARSELESAQRGYLLAHEVWPDDPRVLAGLTRLALAQRDLEAALAWDDRARAQPGSASRSMNTRERCALWQAVAEARIGVDVELAAEVVSRMEADVGCRAQDPWALRAQVHATRALQAQARGETNVAIDESRAAIEVDPSRADVDVLAARWLLDAGREREALIWLSDALARNPGDQALLLLMLEVLGVHGAAAPG